MRIEIEIPKEFEEDFKHDRFEECLTRLNADAHMTAGNYEKETAIMLIKAFKNSKPAYDVDAVVEQLEEEKNLHKRMIKYEQKNGRISSKESR